LEFFSGTPINQGFFQKVSFWKDSFFPWFFSLGEEGKLLWDWKGLGKKGKLLGRKGFS